MILKTTLNMKISSTMNISQSYERIVDDESEADEAGYADAEMFQAYMAGFGRASEEANE